MLAGIVRGQLEYIDTEVLMQNEQIFKNQILICKSNIKSLNIQTIEDFLCDTSMGTNSVYEQIIGGEWDVWL